MPLPEFLTNTPLHPSFDRDIRDTHLIYDYDAQDANGKPEKWRYESKQPPETILSLLRTTISYM